MVMSLSLPTLAESTSLLAMLAESEFAASASTSTSLLAAPASSPSTAANKKWRLDLFVSN